MTKDTGGPAFPGLEPRDPMLSVGAPGMTLRDHYAGQAMAALISGCLASRDAKLIERFGRVGTAAEVAYEYADAMIKERGK